MKRFYSVLLILYCMSSFGQNELYGDWHLLSINYSGEEIHNYFNTWFEDSYTDLDINFSNSLTYGGSSTCNYYSGPFSVDEANNILNIHETTTTLVVCTQFIDNDNRTDFEFKYLDILRPNDFSPNPLEYRITGSGLSSILSLTHTNGNKAIYGKVSPKDNLFANWYLSKIEMSSGNIDIPNEDSPYINLSSFYTNISDNIEFEGSGKCNSFTAQYSIQLYNDNNSLKIESFTPTSITCASNDYESTYFSILSNLTTNYLSYEFLNNRETLVLTNLLGEKLIFEQQHVLSSSESILNDLSIRLNENPVLDVISLSISEQLLGNSKYSIYSLVGKTILSSRLLTNELINVDYLDSGLYFLNITTKDHWRKIIKFIKR